MTFLLRRVHTGRLTRFREMGPEGRRETVDAASRKVLERNWVPTQGFTMPNRRKYPWQWLWDSCFHAIAWSRLGDPRCVAELESVFSLQLADGFVPHMGFQTDPKRSLRLWHVLGRSDITQPPMYGHALGVLAERGFPVGHLYGSASRGLRYLFEHRRDRRSGLIRVVHPWETGCDDSPRWDGWRSGPFNERHWNARKRELVRSLRLQDGVASANPLFEVASAGFSGLVAFNARELGRAMEDQDLISGARELAKAIDAHWLDRERTWSDVCLAGPKTTSSVRTLDALFPALVSESSGYLEAAFAEIFDSGSFWRPFGPSGTAADERSYDPGGYWRGDAWPQEVYLLMLAAQRSGRHPEAGKLAERLVLGCIGSGYAERWNPETGAGLGAVPQSWAALACEGVRVLDGADAQ
jgi:hypothetical protein